MTVTVRRLSRNIKKKYHINLIAGQDGLDNVVKWVHAIEDYDVAKFLRGSELILTTGIGNLKDEDKLLHFVTKLYEYRASGIMINTGPYINTVPSIVVDYCNDTKLPLFTIPWEVRLVDLTRQFCQIIIESEEKGKSLTSLVKDYLFKSNDRGKLSLELTRGGFTQHLNYCVMNIGIIGEGEILLDNKKKEILHEIVEREVNKITNKYVLFIDDSKYVLITGGIKTTVVKELVNNLAIKNVGDKMKVCIAASTNRENLMLLPKNFDLSNRVYNLCNSLSKNVLFYDEIEEYKILLSVAEKNVMKEFEKKILGLIIENDYLEFVKAFIENGANVQQVAQSMCVHRNTIHYKINKVKELTGLSLGDIDDLFKIKLCLLIRDIK